MNFDHFTIFNASAGSGKTYTITQELTNRIAGRDEEGKPCKKIQPSQIIATTFTIKAAAELKSRIREKLLEQDMLGAALELPSALIGTVNSVSSKILQDFAIDAGMNPELTVLDNDGQKAAFLLANEKTLFETEQKYANLFARVGYSTGTYENLHMYSWRNTVERICALARTNNIEPADLKEHKERSIATVKTLFEPYAPDESLRKICAECLDEYPTKFSLTQQQLQEKLDNATATKDIRDLTATLDKFPPAEEKLREYKKILENGTWAKIQTVVNSLPLGLFKNKNKYIKEIFDSAPHNISIINHPDFQSSYEELISLTFDTAQECLVAYARYKKELGLIDFIDQEQQTLELLDSDEVCQAIKDQYKILVVDEFQDTSPLQLAIFMKLAEYMEEVIWVGDPKQSIYRFRGADPQLMMEAFKTIRATGEEHIKTLSKSYRTRPAPLALSNEIFTRSLSSFGIKAEETRLELPTDHQERNPGTGVVNIWRIAETAGQKISLWDALAEGIAREIKEEQQSNTETTNIRRAVLVRSNDDVFSVVSALNEQGISALGDYFTVAATREGIALKAALAFAQDPRDTKALIELIQIFEEHPAHGTWRNQLTAQPGKKERGELLNQWAHHESLAGLRALAAYTGVLSPSDFVRRAIDACNFPGRIVRWSNPHIRYAALDGLVQIAHSYEEHATARSQLTTVQGFLDYFNDGGFSDKQAKKARAAAQDHAVFVGTMHSAKGLEWDRVYVAIKDHKLASRFNPVGEWVQTEGNIDITLPLDKRALYFWPKSLGKIEELTPHLKIHPLQQARRQAEIEEEQRLYYVALTRSKEQTTVMLTSTFEEAMPELAQGVEGYTGIRWKLTGEGVPAVAENGNPAETETPENPGDETAPLPTGVETDSELTIIPWDNESDAPNGQEPVTLPVKYRLLTGVNAKLKLPSERSLTAALENTRTNVVHEPPFIPARFTASKIETSPEQQEHAKAQLATGGKLGGPLVDKGGRQWELVGDAVHGFLALPAGIDEEQCRATAQSMVNRWGVERMGITAQVLLDANKRWKEWVEEHYPSEDGWVEHTEIPFTWTNERGQSASGWMDSVLMRTTPNGDTETVLIDHKTYPGSEPEKHLLKNYVGQMNAYSQVIESATGRKPLRVLMHLPLRGEVWEMTLDGEK